MKMPKEGHVLWREIYTTPTPVIILSLGPVLDAPLKNIYHTPLGSYWIRKSHLEYLHKALSSPEPDKWPESLQRLDCLLRDKKHVILR